MEEIGSSLKEYRCIKIVSAEPMDRETAELNSLVRDVTGENEDGYLVVYSPEYKSWSPAKVFEEGYISKSSDKTKAELDLIRSNQELAIKVNLLELAEKKLKEIEKEVEILKKEKSQPVKTIRA